ncbi:MAG: ECF transporter S component, partial [Oscillospiraceae bacterium]
MQAKQNKTHWLAVVGLMSAVAFISNYLSLPLGDVSRVHFGNVFCVLSGILLGPLPGGLCAGIGAFFYDLTNPLYADEALITFCLKFVIGFLAGAIAHSGGHRGDSFSRNLTGALTGSAAYVALYLAKSFIKDFYLMRNPIETVLTKLLIKAGSSLTNAAIAVAVAMLLAPIFIKAMRQAGIYDRLYPAREPDDG